MSASADLESARDRLAEAAELIQGAARVLEPPYRDAMISALADVIATGRRVGNAAKLLRVTERGAR